MIAMPCCRELMLPQPQDIVYRDGGILSPHNEIRIWLDATGGAA